MGAWGFGVFDNDSSCDFVMELSESENTAGDIKNILDKIINEKEYIELDTAAAAWVCICIIDQKINNIEYDCPDIEYDDIIERTDVSELADLKNSAVTAVDCILSDISELKELIEECEENDYKVWKNSLLEIKKRLSD